MIDIKWAEDEALEKKIKEQRQEEQSHRIAKFVY
jgi:hypothetical protein